MRKFRTALALLLLSLPVLLHAQDSHFKVEPQYPKAGDKLQISFNPAGTELEGASAIEANIYILDDKTVRVEELPMTKSGNLFTGSYEVAKTATVLTFTFLGNDKRENNQKKGYIVQVYDDRQQPVAGSNKAMYRLYDGYDGYVAGIERSTELAFPYIEKEYKAYPENIKENFAPWAAALSGAKKDTYSEILLHELQKLESQENLTEDNYFTLNTWYTRLKQKEKADAVTATMKEKFPDGNWKRNDAFRALNAEKDLVKKEALVQAYLNDFKLDDNQKNGVKMQLASAFANGKQWDKFTALTKDMDIKNLAGMYNNLAWNWAEKNENLDMAKKLSKQATDYAKKEIEKPSGEKPVTRTDKQWIEDRKGMYSMYADTYAFILYKEKDYKNGYIYAKEATDIRKRKDAEYNDRYALLLEKVATPAQVKKELEPLVKEGYAGAEAREVLHRNYVTLNKGEKGYDEYMSKLDAVNLDKLRKELEKKMIAKNAPGFKLVDLKGMEVDFASLKGKTVVVDFWATWCGPCKASFPSMQKMVDRYKSNANVVFLFIDTWENVPNRKKLVEDFVANNKYTFNVLYDNPKEEGSSEFTVVKDYDVEGIPTKFVVDGNGQIRFKSVGWSGNEYSFMKELTMMIEMAGGASVAGENGKKGF